MEKAVEYARILGVGFEIEYPRYRYNIRKSYADNFKWKGFVKEDPDSWKL